MPNAFKLEIPVALTAAALFAKLAPLKSIGTMKIKFVQEQEKRLLFFAPQSLFLPAQNILLLCKQSGEKAAKLIVNSALVSPKITIDFGQNKRNCEIVKKFVDGLLAP